MKLCRRVPPLWFWPLFDNCPFGTCPPVYYSGALTIRTVIARNFDYITLTKKRRGRTSSDGPAPHEYDSLFRTPDYSDKKCRQTCPSYRVATVVCGAQRVRHRCVWRGPGDCGTVALLVVARVPGAVLCKPGRIVLPDVRKIVPTNLQLCHLRVPDCRAHTRCAVQAKMPAPMFAALGVDCWVVVPISSVARAAAGHTLEGTRLTLTRSRDQADAYEFSIRTPVTPARWADFDKELAAGFEVICAAAVAEGAPPAIYFFYLTFLSGIQQLVLTNPDFFHVRVPSCTSLIVPPCALLSTVPLQPALVPGDSACCG